MPANLRTSKMTRWRAASLIGVYVLAAIHIVHWKLNGWTLAPVEPSEMFDTLHLGIITVGFLFMAGLVIATAIAGRFFCSWGCHILALQDLSAWILRKLGIQARPIRSRTLVWVPLLAVVYLFVWPQIERLLAGKPLPKLHVVSSPEGWTSFFTTDLLRSFPGLGMTLFTFAVCGFAIVYFLGSRSFCSYACPYGAMFAMADRVAPLRIVAGDGACTKCGACIATCPSNVRVIDEVDQFGTVINANCMKDLDCITVCPTDALKYGVAKPPAARSWWKPPGLEKTYDFSLGEDLLLAGTFVLVLPIFRGLYDAISFLLALALAAIVAYFAVVALRLWSANRVALGHLELKQDGYWTTHGKWAAATLVLVGLFVVHSGWVQYHIYASQWAIAGIDASDHEDGAPSLVSMHAGAAPQLTSAIHHLEQAANWGLVCPRGLRLQLAALYRQAGDRASGRNQFHGLLSVDPADHTSRLGLAWLWLLDGRGELARRQAEVVLAATADTPSDLATQLRHKKVAAAAHYLLGDLETRGGNQTKAMEHFERSTTLYPHHVEAHLALGSLLAADGDFEAAEARCRSAVELRPDSAAAHNNLAAVLVELDRKQDALTHYQRSVDLLPDNPIAELNVAKLLLDLDRLREAEQMFKKVLSRQPNDTTARAGLEEIRRRAKNRAESVRRD